MKIYSSPFYGIHVLQVKLSVIKLSFYGFLLGYSKFGATYVIVCAIICVLCARMSGFYVMRYEIVSFYGWYIQNASVRVWVGNRVLRPKSRTKLS